MRIAARDENVSIVFLTLFSCMSALRRDYDSVWSDQPGCPFPLGTSNVLLINGGVIGLIEGLDQGSDLLKAGMFGVDQGQKTHEKCLRRGPITLLCSHLSGEQERLGVFRFQSQQPVEREFKAIEVL